MITYFKSYKKLFFESNTDDPRSIAYLFLIFIVVWIGFSDLKKIEKSDIFWTWDWNASPCRGLGLLTIGLDQNPSPDFCGIMSRLSH